MITAIAVCIKFVYQTLRKCIKLCGDYSSKDSLQWTPEGKRIITGASTGEFTLWNGTAFNFETILQAPNSADVLRLCSCLLRLLFMYSFSGTVES